MSASWLLQGWQRHKVYPDFVFAHLAGDGRPQLVVLESKGCTCKARIRPTGRPCWRS